MTPPSGAAVAQELSEISRRLDALASGDVGALDLVRPALHRLVVAPGLAAPVKTLLVQALLLLDDPRVADGASGAPFVTKIRKLVSAAAAADVPGQAPTATSRRAAFSPDSLLPSDIDQSLLDDFVAESREQLEIAEAALLVLDSEPDDAHALETVFRALHSIKGTSAFLGIEHVTELAHHAESLLERVRVGTATCSGELANALFRAIDALDAILCAIEQFEREHHDLPTVPEGYRDVLAAMRDALAGDARATPRRTSGQFRRLLSADLSVRVRVDELDRLMGVVQELVLATSMIARDASVRGNPDLARKTTFAERLAFEVEDMARELRTVPFSATLQRLARLARDAAYQSGKTIDLTLEGDDVAIERVMADALADPLMHMVRNAVDHGLESPDERVPAGKPVTGRLTIAAHRANGQLVIELSDDGRGIDPKHLTRVAVERGFVSPEARLSDADAFQLLFRPGFSTATVVTDLSGRGVGMDVVRTNLDAIGGKIEIASRVGTGTTFTIRLPFRTQSAREESIKPAQSAQRAQRWGDSERTIGLIA
jgi:two-component system chemotaxis sensor kinase CheA